MTTFLVPVPGVHSFLLLIFKSSANDLLQSFSMPFYYMKDFEIKQPTFGANYLGGRILAQPGGDWQGEARFKLTFKSGGAVTVGQALIKIAKQAPTQPPPHPKAQGTAPQPAAQPYPQPVPQAYPQGYPQGYPQQQPYPAYYPPQGQVPPQGYAYPTQPYYPPQQTAPPVPPGELPPPYEYAVGNGMPQTGNAYYTPTNPGQVYVPQPPTATLPFAGYP
ncbi:putative WW domain-binding protein 2-like [Apostichopus japonicus]|uniref:Putative WW domain-binding protein 2-like n=1 Tax=Stichopus japonicus TaxID=307972 RepID=A0A2G8KBW3_STIJA|nr:putative WW domain-binding protein 2-like [Apostichopus japonicus]